MINLLRSARHALTLGTLLATTPLNAQEPEDTGLQSFGDIPQATMDTIDAQVAEGPSIVYLYGSSPERESVLKTEWANYTLFNSISYTRSSNLSFYRLDLQSVVDHFGDDSKAERYMISRFSVSGFPAVVIFCNGEIQRTLNPFLPVIDKSDPGFSNPTNQEKSKVFSQKVAKGFDHYAGLCQ